MSKQSRERWYDRLKARAAEVTGASAVTEEPRGNDLILPNDDPYWMIDGCTPGRRSTFLHAIGGRYGGSPYPTSAFILDQWSSTPNGLQWMLDPNPVKPGVELRGGRGTPILTLVFDRTRTALIKLACGKHAGDLEVAIREALDQQMTVYGIDLEPAHA